MRGKLVRILGRLAFVVALVLLAFRGGGATGGGATSSTGACRPEAASKEGPNGKQYLVIATGGTGGVYFPYGGGLARVLSARMSGAQASAEVTGGSVDNMNLIGINDGDVGFTTADSVDEGFKEQGV